MEKHTVLICDDSETVHSSLRGHLETAGFEVVSAYDGETALTLLQEKNIRLLLLDVILPGISGFDVCREVRKMSDIYIIMLSARTDDIDRIVGMELGADDYVTKPFSPRVLAVRVKRALDRLFPAQAPKKLTLAELTVYPESYRVFVRDEEVQASSKDVEVLSYFLENEGKVLSREQILRAAWGYEYFGDTRVVDSVIKRLRQKIMRDGVHFTIRTVYGAGYKIERV